MENNNLKKRIMDSINNDCVPNLQTRIVSKYQQNKKQKRQTKSFLLITSPLLMAGCVALAIVIPNLAKKTTTPQNGVAPLLAKDTQEVSFNLEGATSALSIINQKNNLGPNMRFSAGPEDVFDLTEDVENMFEIVNPYMPTVETLLDGEKVQEKEIVVSDHEDYQFMIGDFYFNMLNETETTYDIEGVLLSINVPVTGGRFYITEEDESLSVFSLNFQYSETSYLSFSHIYYEHEKEIVDYFHDQYKHFMSTDYYEYALYENDEVTSFTSLNRFIRDDKIFIYMYQNVPYEDSYVNAELRFENDEENGVINAKFDLIDDHRSDSHFKDHGPIHRDDKGGHHHDEPKHATTLRIEEEPPIHFGGRINGIFKYYEDETSYNYEYLLQRGGFIQEDFSHRHNHPHDELPELKDKEYTLYQILK